MVVVGTVDPWLHKAMEIIEKEAMKITVALTILVRATMTMTMKITMMTGTWKKRKIILHC